MSRKKSDDLKNTDRIKFLVVFLIRKWKLILNYEVYSSSRRAQDGFLLKVALEMAKADTESDQTQEQIRSSHQAHSGRELTARHGRQHHAFSSRRKMPRNSFPERDQPDARKGHKIISGLLSVSREKEA